MICMFYIHSVHSPFCKGGRGLEPPTKFSKRGVLTGPQLLEGVAGKEGGDFFQRGGWVQFSHKKKLKKLKIKNSNWELLPKDLVTFKR